MLVAFQYFIELSTIRSEIRPLAMLSIRHGVKRTRCSLFANTIPSTVDFSNRVACRWHSNSIPTSTTTSSSSSSEAVGESSTNDDVVSISRLISMHQHTVTAESLPRATSLKEPSSSFATSSSSSLRAGMGSNNMKPTTPGDSVSDPVDSATVGPDSTHSPVASREQSLESMLDDINPILAAQRLRRRILQPWFDIKAKIEGYHQRFQQALPKIKLALTMTAIALVGVATWMSVRTIIQTFEDLRNSAISMHNRVEEFVTNMEYRWEHREERLQKLQESIIATKDDVVHSIQDTVDTLSKAEENIQKAKESIEEKRQALITSLDVRMNEVKEEVETKLDRIRNREIGQEDPQKSPKELKLDFDRLTELGETISSNADKLLDKVSLTWLKASESEELKSEQTVKDNNNDDSKSKQK